MDSNDDTDILIGGIDWNTIGNLVTTYFHLLNNWFNKILLSLITEITKLLFYPFSIDKFRYVPETRILISK